MKQKTQTARAAKVYGTDFMSAEVDNLIASAERRVEQQRYYVRSVASDFEASMRAISELDKMVSSLDKLKSYRARLAEEDKAPGLSAPR